MVTCTTHQAAVKWRLLEGVQLCSHLVGDLVGADMSACNSHPLPQLKAGLQRQQGALPVQPLMQHRLTLPDSNVLG
jgi:hypothetical protein